MLSGSTGNPGGERNVASTNLCIDGSVPSISHGYDNSDIVDTFGKLNTQASKSQMNCIKVNHCVKFSLLVLGTRLCCHGSL